MQASRTHRYVHREKRMPSKQRRELPTEQVVVNPSWQRKQPPTHPSKTVLHIDTLGKPSGAYITHSFEQVRESRFQARSSKTRIVRKTNRQRKNIAITNMKWSNWKSKTQINCTWNPLHHCNFWIKRLHWKTDRWFFSCGGEFLRNPSCWLLQHHLKRLGSAPTNETFCWTSRSFFQHSLCPKNFVQHQASCSSIHWTRWPIHWPHRNPQLAQEICRTTPISGRAGLGIWKTSKPMLRH